MEGQTAASKGQGRGWLLLPETRRFGRRSRPLTTPKALTTSGSRGGRRALTVRPANTRRTRRVRIHKGRGRGRPRPPPTQRMRDGEVGGDQRRTLDLRNHLSQNVLVKKTNWRSRSHRKGATLSLRHRNGGVREEALTTLGSKKSRPSGSGASLLGQRSRH